jgi:hypothetical protein
MGSIGLLQWYINIYTYIYIYLQAELTFNIVRALHCFAINLYRKMIKWKVYLSLRLTIKALFNEDEWRVNAQFHVFLFSALIDEC